MHLDFHSWRLCPQERDPMNETLISSQWFEEEAQWDTKHAPFATPHIELHGVKAKSCAVLACFYYKVGSMSMKLNKKMILLQDGGWNSKTLLLATKHIYIGLGFSYVREQKNVFFCAKQLCNFAKRYMMSHWHLWSSMGGMMGRI